MWVKRPVVSNLCLLYHVCWQQTCHDIPGTLTTTIKIVKADACSHAASKHWCCMRLCCRSFWKHTRIWTWPSLLRSISLLWWRPCQWKQADCYQETFMMDSDWIRCNAHQPQAPCSSWNRKLIRLRHYRHHWLAWCSLSTTVCTKHRDVWSTEVKQAR